MFAGGDFLYAQEFTSSNFKISNPVIAPTGFSTSTSFQLNSIISQIAIGTSSATSFKINSGFLYFPYISTPTVSATAGDAQTALSWTGASGALGWSVGGYTVGQATASGGPYSYTTLGDVTSKTMTGLTNGTAYYFVVRVRDAFNNFIATSSEVSATPVAPASSSSSAAGGSGGGGGGSTVSATGVNFSGRTYPKSSITLLRDAQVTATTIAGADASFQISLSNLSGGKSITPRHSRRGMTRGHGLRRVNEAVASFPLFFPG